MLWLYSGNDRFRTDMKTREKLVDAVEIGGATYGEDKLILNDSEYLDDEVLLSFNYYAESHTSPFDTPLGSCLIKHDLTTKLNSVVYCTQGTTFRNILFASADGRIVVCAPLQYILLENGTVTYLDQPTEAICCSNNFISDYCLSENYIGYTIDGVFYYKTWQDEEWTQYRPDATFDRIYNSGDMIFFSAENDDYGYTLKHTTVEAYNMISGKSATISAPDSLTDCILDSQSGYYVLGSLSSDRERFENYKLYKFDSESMTSRLVTPLADADMRCHSVTVDGKYINFYGQNGEGKSLNEWFDTEGEKFTDEPPLNVLNYAGEFGDFYFYYSYSASSISSQNGYCALHRVNKQTGEDDVTAVLSYDGINPYLFDIVLDY